MIKLFDLYFFFNFSISLDELFSIIAKDLLKEIPTGTKLPTFRTYGFH